MLAAYADSTIGATTYLTPICLDSSRSRIASQPPIFTVTGNPAARVMSTKRKSSSRRVPSASNSALTLTIPKFSRPRVRISTILRSVLFMILLQIRYGKSIQSLELYGI